MDQTSFCHLQMWMHAAESQILAGSTDILLVYPETNHPWLRTKGLANMGASWIGT
jgi:hypothetical protein